MDISGDAWDGIGEMKEPLNLGIDLAAQGGEAESLELSLPNPSITPCVGWATRQVAPTPYPHPTSCGRGEHAARPDATQRVSSQKEMSL